MEKECAFLKGEAITPLLKRKPAPVVKPEVPAGTLMLDAAIDQYKESLVRRRKSEKAVTGYRPTDRTGIILAISAMGESRSNPVTRIAQTTVTNARKKVRSHSAPREYVTYPGN